MLLGAQRLASLTEDIAFVDCNEPPLSFFELLPSRFRHRVTLVFEDTFMSEERSDLIVDALPGLPSLEDRTHTSVTTHPEALSSPTDFRE